MLRAQRHKHPSLVSRRPLPACRSSHGFMATSHLKSVQICHALPLCRVSCIEVMGWTCVTVVFVFKMEHIVFGGKEHILSKQLQPHMGFWVTRVQASV